MPDNGHLELTWSWVTLIPLVALILLLVAAVWVLSHKVRVGLTFLGVVIAAIFTFIAGPIAWATLAQALRDNWLATGIGLLVIFAIGLVTGRK